MNVIRSAFDAWKFKPSRASLIRLLEASQQLIFGVCYEVLRHREDSEDATQRVLLEIQKGLDQIQDPEHFLRRLRLVAFRTALDTRRDRRRRIDRERKAADMNPSSPLPEEIREAIHEAMAALDEDSRSLVMEHYFEKATLDDMGKRRGVSGAAMWKRIEEVKGRLRNGLALAGLAAAASKAEACLESVTLATPAANLVTGATIAGGGLMAAQTSTATAATLVAALTFALGLGGGFAIRATRSSSPLDDRASANAPAFVRENETSPHQDKSRRASGANGVPAPTTAEQSEDRLRLAREIWAQFSRRRFWKDRDAQDETLPKLKHLGPDQATFFVERFRSPETTSLQKRQAATLAVTCGGPEASSLLLDVVLLPDSEEARNLRLGIRNALTGGYAGRFPEIPLESDLRNGTMALLKADYGWDRAFALTLLGYGDATEWMPIVTEASVSDREWLIRAEAIRVLAQRGDTDALAFLRERREAICRMSPDPVRHGTGAAGVADSFKDLLGKEVDDAIKKLELKVGK